MLVICFFNRTEEQIASLCQSSEEDKSLRAQKGSYLCTGRCLTGIIDAWEAGDIEKARELQNFAQEVINVICHYRGNIVGGKRIMKLIGFDLGKNRTPFNNMTDEEEANMKKELEAIDFFNKCNLF